MIRSLFPALRLPILAGILAAALPGCSPTCEDTCEKLLACDGVESPRVSEQDCQQSCNTQQDVYQSYDDSELQQAFADHKQCVEDETCGAIADGVCYDERLYAWPADGGTDTGA